MKYIILFITLASFQAYAFSNNIHDILFNKQQNTTNRKNNIPIIKNEYHKWKGISYKFGGTDSMGIDCSALIQELAERLNVSLPRTTRQQMKAGVRINKQDLSAGDLVFFRTSETDLHVGMYIENGKFVHASTTKGVTISSLDNAYWKAHYDRSVRVTG